MIKFKSLEFLGLSHRIPRKIKNAIYSLEISALVPEIFKFKKCVKYANERTNDVIHLTQCNIKYINRAIVVNLQLRPLKLGRLIVLQATQLQLSKFWFPWQLTLFQSPQCDFIIFGYFKLKKHLTGHQLDQTYLYPDEASLENIKIERQRRPAKLLISGRSGTQYVAMVTKLVIQLILWSTCSTILLQRIKHF